MLKPKAVLLILLALPAAVHAQEQTAKNNTYNAVDWTKLHTQMDNLATSNTLILKSIQSVAACSAQLNFYAPKQAKASPTTGCATP